MIRLLLFILLFSAHQAAGQKTIYVSQAATGANDGTSWADAFVFLQDGLTVAVSGDEVWVAEGMYRPDQGLSFTLLDQDAVFTIKAGVSLFGGFRGSETAAEQRQGPSNEYETILTGDLLGNDSIGTVPDPDSPEYSDNSLAVLFYVAPPGSPQVALDRFTVTGANGLRLHKAMVAGGPCVLRNIEVVENMGSRAISVSSCSVIDALVVARNRSVDDGTLSISGPVVIKGSHFEDNISAQTGGAVLVAGGDTVLVSNTTFINNRAFYGGALSTIGSPIVVLVSTQSIGNHATCGGGALLLDESASIIAINSLFGSNVALADCSATEFSRGGAALIFGGTFEAYNSTFSGNSAQAGGDAIAFLRSEGGLYNSIVSGNSLFGSNVDIRIDDSTVEMASVLHDEPLPLGVVRSGLLIAGDARFLDPLGADGQQGTVDDDYRIAPDSPAVDVGDNALIPPDYADLDQDGNRSELTSLDLYGNPRVLGASQNASIVDLGLHEAPSATRIEVPVGPASSFSGCALEPFPIPFKGSLNLIITHSVSRVRVEVFDMIGRPVHARFAPASTERDRIIIDASTWAAGPYLVKATSVAGSCSKVVIHR